MNIIPKAKPINFRIVSGGVECSSLNDLINHFDFNSIVETVKDGRLSKWLVRIKEPELANKIDEIRDLDFSTIESRLKLTAIFTGKTYDRSIYSSTVDYIAFLEEDALTIDIAKKLFLDNYKKSEEVLLFAYHHHKELIPDIFSAFGSFADNGTPEIEWIYGKELLGRGRERDIKAGQCYIQNAAKKGFSKACEYILTKEYKTIISSCDKEKITGELTKIFGTSANNWAKESARICNSIKHLISSNAHSNNTKDALKLCLYFCEVVGIKGSTTGIKTIREMTPESKSEEFGSMKDAYLFLQLYARESTLIMQSTIEKYRKLNFDPARQRAEQFQSGRTYDMSIKAPNGIKINMPENPDSQDYKYFLYYFLINILYF